MISILLLQKMTSSSNEIAQLEAQLQKVKAKKAARKAAEKAAAEADGVGGAVEINGCSKGMG